jgi:hypothetical protein
MDWIAELAKERERTQMLESLQLHKAAIISSSAKYLIRDLTAQLRRDIDQWNAFNPRPDDVSMRRVGPGFVLFRAGPNPTATCLITQNGSKYIDLEFSCSLSYESGQKEWNTNLTITVDVKDNCALSHGGTVFPHLGAVSRFILEPLFKPSEHWDSH